MFDTVKTLLCLSLVALATAQAQDDIDCRSAEEYVTHLGFRYALGRSFPDGTIESISFRTPDYSVRYVRLLIRLLDPEGQWHLVIRDRDGRPLESLGAANFAAAGEQLWTSRLEADYLRFDTINRSGSSERRLIVDEAIVMPQRVANPYYSVQDPNAIKFRDLFEDGVNSSFRRVGDSIGFLMTTSGNRTWSCSAVVVAEDLVLTNWHCGGTTLMPRDQYWNEQVCRNTLIDLSWDGDGMSSEYECKNVLAVDRDLDYAVLQVNGIGHSRTPRPVVINPDAAPGDGERATVLHHPLGRTKQITAGCKVVSSAHPGWTIDENPGAGTSRITHNCDTEGGSSGAPVFNGAWEVIALHHAGFERDPETCRAVDKVNKAVRMGNILESLNPELRDRILVATRPHSLR